MILEATAGLLSTNRTNYPSAVSVSPDGQILLLTHSTLHILTPSITLGNHNHVDRTALSGLPGNKSSDQWTLESGPSAFSSVRVSPKSSTESNADEFLDGQGEAAGSWIGDPDIIQATLEEDLQECKGFEMFKNGIEARIREVEWEDWINDERLIVSGGLDNGWRMASWSPSGLSELGGCVLATLNVNHELIIYAPGGDPIKSTWTATFDLTSALLEVLSQGNNEDLVSGERHVELTIEQRKRRELLVMRAQTSTVSWSPATPAHAVKDESVLAVGHRSGEVSFWRYDPNGSMHIMKMVLVLEVWPILIVWSSWQSRLDPVSQQLVYSIQLAVAGTSGPVQVLRLSILPDSSLQVNQEHTLLAQSKTVTFMRWLDGGRLLLARIGEISVWTPLFQEYQEVRTFNIAMDTFQGWPSVPCPISADYLPGSDTLQIALNDGTFRVIERFSTPDATVQSLSGPILALPQDTTSPNRSIQLSEESKRLLLAVDKTDQIKRKTSSSPFLAMRLGGFTSIDPHRKSSGAKSGLFLWLYEKELQDTKVYAMATLHKSTFLMTNVYDKGLARRVLSELDEVLKDPPAAAMQSASGVLLSIFTSLRHFHANEPFSRALLRTLSANIDMNHTKSTSATSPDEISNFLLTDKRVQSARLAGLVAKYWLTHCTTDNDRRAAKALCNKIALQLYFLVFSSLLRVLDIRGLDDSPLAIRYRQIVENMKERQGEAGHEVGLTTRAPEAFENEIDERDSCAACGETVPLYAVGKAKCRNGHSWLRCSITLDVLYTAAARTCMVCRRKTKVPPSVMPPEATPEEQAEYTLLTMSRCCLFCSGRWTRGH